MKRCQKNGGQRLYLRNLRISETKVKHCSEYSGFGQNIFSIFSKSASCGFKKLSFTIITIKNALFAFFHCGGSYKKFDLFDCQNLSFLLVVGGLLVICPVGRSNAGRVAHRMAANGFGLGEVGKFENRPPGTEA